MPPSKRQKLNHSIPPHPHGIEPFGNSLISTRISCRKFMGHFVFISDELLVELLGRLGPECCSRLAETCKALYVFGLLEENWRRFTTDRFGGQFKFSSSWRNTFKLMDGRSTVSDVPIRVTLFSDLLFTSWRCSNVDLDILTNPKRTSIERRGGLSLEEFVNEYAIPEKPVILTGLLLPNLEFDAFVKSERLFRAEAVDMTFKDYLNYMESCTEESPLYLFDKACGGLTFKVPSLFNQDLFALLAKRPDFKWLIVGPRRSGSTFHVDPNATSAWNAVLKGRKKWILSPPSHPPPGVYPSGDGSEVTSPVCLVEWYLNWYEHCEFGEGNMLEGVCEEGEVMYIPSRWWHSVMNLEQSIALTQNFVATYNLPNVLRFLRDKPDQISGFSGKEGVFEDFVKVLRTSGVLEGVDPALLESKMEKSSKWDALSTGGDFSFSF